MSILSSILRQIEVKEEVRAASREDNAETRRIHNELGYAPERADPATIRKWGAPPTK